jgi:hypothetical protein
MRSFQWDGVAVFLGIFNPLLGLDKIYKDGHLSIGICLFILHSIVQSILLLYLERRRRDFYYKHREAITIANLQSKMFLFYFYAMRTPAFLSVHTIEPFPTETGKAIMHLIKFPAIAFRQLVTFILPMNTARTNALVSGYFMAAFSLERCELELASIPMQGQRYLDFFDKIENFVFQYVPLPPAIPISKPITGFSGGLNEYQACLACKNIFQIIVGYLLPLTMVFIQESVSRHLFHKRAYPHQFTANHGLSGLIIWHLLLLPLQAAVVLQILVPLLRWKF